MDDERFLEALEQSNKAVLAQLNARLQAMIPTYVEETGQLLGAPASTTNVLKIQPYADTFFKVTGFLVLVPFGCTAASLELGNGFSLPLQNTTTLLCPVQRILRSTDLRQLTFTTGTSGGDAFVWLWGDKNPSYGKL